MLTYVIMKLLERRPERYDARLARLSGGRILRVRERAVALLAAELPPGAHVLELGCGTAALGLALVERGFRVTATDASPAMIAEAERRRAAHPQAERLTLRVQAVAGLDALPTATLDAVVATLLFSELSADERRYALAQAHRGLRPGGWLLLGDEVRPRTRGGRLRHGLGRAPALALTYLVTGQTSTPLVDPVGELRTAGFVVTREERSHRDAFALLLARRGDAPTDPGGAS